MHKTKTAIAGFLALALAASCAPFGAAAAFAAPADGEDVELELIEPVADDPNAKPFGEDGFWTLAQPFVNDPFTAISNPTPSYENQYWAYTTRLLEAWEAYGCESDVAIAVIDSGAMTVHEDLHANVLHDLAWDAYVNEQEQTVGADYLGKPLDVSLGKGGDCAANGHGTHVSGIAAAVANNGVGLAGASYNAKLIPINVVGATGAASLNSVIRAYKYVFSLIDSGKANVRVVNLSLGSTQKSADRWDLEEVIIKAREEYGIVTVCAGGNDGVTSKIFPGDYDACISVTALEPDGTNMEESDYNEFKDISAPGRYIWSAKATELEVVTPPAVEDEIQVDNGAEGTGEDASALSSATDGIYDEYKSMGGTSMAAPVVSGAVAFMLSVVPDATPDEVCEALYATATPIVDPDNDRSQTSGSAGALDAKAAVDYLVEHHYKKFSDVSEGDWFFDAVRFATDNGIMNGDKGATTFRPNSEIKREEAAAVLYNYFAKGSPVFENGEVAPAAPHTDVEQGEWYSDAVNWVVAMGYMNGHAGTDRFGVGEMLTRQELACLMINITGTDLETVQLDDTKFLALPDHADTEGWAEPSMIWVTSQGIINGSKNPDGTRFLLPKKGVTRAEMAAIMMNAITNGLLSSGE